MSDFGGKILLGPRRRKGQRSGPTTNEDDGPTIAIVNGEGNHRYVIALLSGTMVYDRILAVFDLDYTVWQPEMYQLYGKPHYVPTPDNLSAAARKEAKTIKEGMVLKDMHGSVMRVFHGASVALAEINQLRADGLDIRAAVASRTDEPGWAKFCMDNMVVEDGTTLSKCFGSRVEISFDNKKSHFKRLHKSTGIPYEQMLFFDNEYSNIRSVSSLGVKCIYTPDGMQKEHWEEAKKAFDIVA